MESKTPTVFDLEGRDSSGPIRAYERLLFREEGVSVRVYGEVIGEPGVEMVGFTANGQRVRAELFTGGGVPVARIKLAIWLKREVDKVLATCRLLPIIGRMAKRIVTVRTFARFQPIALDLQPAVVEMLTDELSHRPTQFIFEG